MKQNAVDYSALKEMETNKKDHLTAEVGTYELSGKLLSTPSDGIAPARKLADTLLHTQSNHNENVRVTFSNKL